MLAPFAEVSEELGRLFCRGFTGEEIQAFERALERILDNLTTADDC